MIPINIITLNQAINHGLTALNIMNKTSLAACLFALVCVGNHPFSVARAQGTAFTYQGRLNSGGLPANGLYHYQFKLYAYPLGNTQVGSGYLTNAIPVTNGLFVTTIDFGAGIFIGGTNWLEIEVRTNGATSYTLLSPLQGVTPTPNAIFATTAANVSGTIPAAQLGGTILNLSLPASPKFSGTVNAGSFSGDGANLTNVNAAWLNGKAATNFWETGGNARTSPAAGDFVGTADNQPLEVRANNSRVLRFEPDSSNHGAPNVIAGASVNFVAAGIYGATIGGGGATNVSGQTVPNGISANFSSIGGGCGNTVSSSADDSVIGGGVGNSISTNSSVSSIGGGYYNAISPYAYFSTISGGDQNAIGFASIESTIGGGAGNDINAASPFSTIGGGYGNLVNSVGVFVGGGGFDGVTNSPNRADGAGAAIAGGVGNFIHTNSLDSVIVGGANNIIYEGCPGSFIGGGQANSILNSSCATVGGGAGNFAGGQYNSVGGGFGNYAAGYCSSRRAGLVILPLAITALPRGTGHWLTPLAPLSGLTHKPTNSPQPAMTNFLFVRGAAWASARMIHQLRWRWLPRKTRSCGWTIRAMISRASALPAIPTPPGISPA